MNRTLGHTLQLFEPAAHLALWKTFTVHIDTHWVATDCIWWVVYLMSYVQLTRVVGTFAECGQVSW